MEKQNKFSLAVTPEELIAAIKLCGGGLIYAFESPLQSLISEAKKSESRALENLQKKGLLDKDALGNYAMDLKFSEILDVIRYPEIIVLVNPEGKNEPFSIYLNSEDQVVWAPAGEKSRLIVFKDHDAIWLLIEELFKDKPADTKISDFQIEALELEIAQHFLSENRFDDALQVFVDKGIVRDNATDFLNCALLSNSKLRLDLTKINRLEDNVTSSKVEVLCCPQRFFWIEYLLKREGTGARIVQIYSGGIKEIREKFLTLIAQNY